MDRLRYDPDQGFVYPCNCNETWCEHIEDAVTDRFDAEIFWDFVEKFPSTNYWPIGVPVIPTEGVFAFAKIARANTQAPWAMFLVRENPFEPHVEGLTHRLATTGPGEGLLVWRGLIWDYFRSQVQPEHTKCTSRAHNFAAQGKLAADLKKEGSKASHAQVFSIWYQGACTICLQKRNASYYAGEDDLIPQIGKKQSWADFSDKPKRRY